MGRKIWHGMLGGSLVSALLLLATAIGARAEAPAQGAKPTAAKPAVHAATPAGHPSAKPAKPAPAAVAHNRSPAHPAKQLAAAKPKPPATKLTAAPKRATPPQRVAAVAKSAAPIKAAAAPPAPPSYTITTTRNNVTYTTTRIVPLPLVTAAASEPAVTPRPVIAAAPSAAKAAAVPVSLVQTAAAKPQAPAAATAAAVPAKPAQPAAATPPAPAAAVPVKPAQTSAAKTPAPAAVVPVSLTEPTPRSVAVAVKPADPKSAASFVAAFLTEAFHIAKSEGTALQRRAQLADLFASKMDVKRIAGYTTGSELAVASSAIQQRFRTVLVSYLVETYYPQLELASDPSVRVETAPAGSQPDGTAVVWTTFTKDGWGSQSVKWHLVNDDGRYKIVDIFSAGASLVQMERDTFLSVMRNGGLNELMAKLDQRTKELATAATE